MAWFDPRSNRGLNNYDVIESGYGGLKHGFVGYSTNTTSQSYESIQRVAQYGGIPAWPGPIQGVVDNPLHWARFPTHHSRPKKDDDSYQTYGPPTSDYHYGTYTNSSGDESDDDERDFVGKNRFNGPKPKNMKEEDCGREKPRAYSYHEKPKSDGYKPPSYTVRVSTPPKKDPYRKTSDNEKPNDDTYNNSPPSYTVNGSTHPNKDPYLETSNNEKLKSNIHNNKPPSYIVNGSTHPIKDPYRETSNSEKPNGNTHSNSPPFNGSTHLEKDPYRSNSEKHKGNTHSNSSPFNGSTHPKNDPYRETSNNERPIGNTHSNSPPFNGSIHLKRDPYQETTNNEKPKVAHTYSNSPLSRIVIGSAYPENESYHEKLNNEKGNESTHPKKDPYHETSHNPHDTYNEKPKSNTYGPPSYVAHHTTQPRKDPDHETSTYRPNVYPLPPIKTSTNKGSGYLGESTRDSPVAVGTQRLSPRKDHEMIDSAEAQRLYGRAAAPRVEAPAGQYKGTIDSQEAARRYNGVFVNFPMK